jgi:hypothetical protein
MNRKINTALAIAVIIIIAGILGGTIWLAGKKQNQTSESSQQSRPIVKQKTQQQAGHTENQIADDPTLNSSSSVPVNPSEDNKEILKQQILDLYEKSQIKKPNYLANYTLNVPEFDMNSSGPIKVSVKHEGKTVGSFEGYNGGSYVPVYEVNDDLFIISYCGGIGGMCRGDFIKYNIATNKKTTIKTNTLDFFVSNDGKKLIAFTVDDDWLTFNMWMFNFETAQVVDQSITLKCSALSNIRKNCKDLLLENGQEIVYVPLEYDGVNAADAYKLTSDSNSKATKFIVPLEALSQYKLIFPVYMDNN